MLKLESGVQFGAVAPAEQRVIAGGQLRPARACRAG